MQRAAGYAPLDVLELLVVHGGIVRDSDLIAHAAFAHSNGRSGRLEAVRCLLKHGALINAYYGDNTTEGNGSCLIEFVGRQNALHFAIGSGKTDLVELLIEKGADRTLATCSPMKTQGQTVSPVELARMCAYEDIIRMLESLETVT